MPIKLKTDIKELSNKKFSIKPKGYDALEVDATLDNIIKDYETIENNILMSYEEHKALIEEITRLRNENVDLNVALDKEKNKWKYVNMGDKGVHIDNLVLLKRIGKLEKYIHDRFHVNPDEIDFGPDDC